MKRYFYSLFISCMVIVVLMPLSFDGFTILSFVNASFIIGGISTFLGGSIFLLSSGFFDLTAYGMKKAFAPKTYLEHDEETRYISELVTIPYLFLLWNGLTLLALMGIGIFFLYA